MEERGKERKGGEKKRDILIKYMFSSKEGKGGIRGGKNF